MRNKGMTLIEILIVVLIISIIAVIGIPRIINLEYHAKSSGLKSALDQIRQAVHTRIHSNILDGLASPYQDTNVFPTLFGGKIPPNPFVGSDAIVSICITSNVANQTSRAINIAVCDNVCEYRPPNTSINCTTATASGTDADWIYYDGNNTSQPPTVWANTNAVDNASVGFRYY